MKNNLDEYLEYLYVTDQLDDNLEKTDEENKDEIDEDKTLKRRI